MSDKEMTRFAPRNFGPAAKTVVMDAPPRMTMHFDAATPEEPVAVPSAPPLPRRTFDPRATRLAMPPMPPHQTPANGAMEFTTGELVRGPQTRIARSSQPAEPTSTLSPMRPPPPDNALQATPWQATPPGTAPSGMRAIRHHLEKKSTKQRVLIAGAALLAALVLLLPLSSSSADSHSVEEAQVETEEEQGAAESLAPVAAESLAPVAAATPTPKNVVAQAAPAIETAKVEAPTTKAAREEAPTTKATEEQAAAMLLSGRRPEALVLYQELAGSASSSPGVEAMVLVLSQKVEAR